MLNSMKQRTLFTYLSSETNQKCFSITLVVLRVVLGVQLLLAGIAKFGDWSAAGYLNGASGPFAGFFQSLAGSPFVDALNAWGLVLIGLALILGLMVRPASFFGAILMLLYYFAHFEQNTAHGFIDSHIIYIIVFVLFMSGGVGHVFGLDSLARPRMKKNSTLGNILFG